ncbi:MULTISPECIES: hypothetical protein [unclassified Rummeliibacillus]|uniref:hypothetical protein n=1 Tax=unclassified Rummeliibacillus TaxID=2622809 RepID=UPI000E66039B|nr:MULTISPECIES: hypothetical protein [unclassified Rummeliibacillus]RIJ64515.1 hypothetical protein D1606_10070 [Rummeliibacillus sp. POC4]RPJ94387.1 hypothetical protein CW357_15605 [Rummeliibacillus sp. TYF005]
MNILKLLLFYVIILGIGGIFTWLNVPTTYSLLFFIFLAIAVVGYYAYTMTASKKTNAILRQVRFQKSNPIYAHILAIKEGTKEDEIEALDKLIKKNKNNHDGRMDYEFQRAVRLGDFAGAKKIADSMKNGPLKSYNQAYAEALAGKYGVARNKPFYQSWMKHSIEAVIAKKQNNKERYQSEMEQAVEESKGIQRLTNQVTLEKTLKEWK